MTMAACSIFQSRQTASRWWRLIRVSVIEPHVVGWRFVAERRAISLDRIAAGPAEKPTWFIEPMHFRSWPN